jgi:DNA-binding response OmpR family regulator
LDDEQAVKTILIIDDDKNLQKILGIFLKKAGYKMFSANNGEECKQVLDKLRPDLIILDLVMPVLDGKKFLHWLRLEAKLDMPVLILTALSKSEVKSEVLELGVSDVIFKPCYPNALVEAVQKIVG